MPPMNDAQMQQAIVAYYYAQWDRAWRSPMNPLRDDDPAPPVDKKPRRQERLKTQRLEPARTGDKADTIDVEFVRLR